MELHDFMLVNDPMGPKPGAKPAKVKAIVHGTYGHDHGRRHGVIESMLLWRVAARALSLGINVILDFGFWAKEERDDHRSRAKELGAVSEVIYTDVDDEE